MTMLLSGFRRVAGPGGRVVRYGVLFLFFSAFFLFLLIHVDPAVIYTANGINIHNYVAVVHAQEGRGEKAARYDDPSFRREFILELTPAYFGKIATEPGGWTRFAVTLGIYACHYPLAGAVAVTGFALFFFWIFGMYIREVAGARSLVPGCIPPLFLLTLSAWYELSYCLFLVPVAGALALAIVAGRFRCAAIAPRALLLTLVFWCAWYLMQWGSLLVLVFTVILEVFARRERRIAAIALTAAVNGALLVSLDLALLPITMTIRWSDFLLLSGLPIAVIGFFPVAAIVSAVAKRLYRVPHGRAAVVVRALLAFLFACGMGATGLWLMKDPVNRDTRIVARTLHHVMNNRWEAVLQENTTPIFRDFPGKAGQLQALMVHATAHALCRTGRLGDRLFDYPQKGFAGDPLLLLDATRSNGYVNWLMVLELAMTLGMVNTAEKVAGEIVENVGPFPDIVYRRALVQIAAGNREAAAVYLGKLAGMPYYRVKAGRLLQALHDDTAVYSEPRIASMRANRDSVDYFLFTVSYDTLYQNLLQSNPHNKAAYEYLMTWYLLNGRLDSFAALIPGAGKFGYAMLPRCWEEALCVYLAASGGEGSAAPELSKFRPETVRRFNEFAKACMNQQSDSGAAAALAPGYGNSYFYYSIFGYTPGRHHE